MDLDDPSDEYSDESEDPHEPEGDVDTQSCASLNSWCIQNAGNLKALDILETQSDADDAVSVVSGSSWALSCQVVDNDDTASVSSFQMVSSVQVVDNDDTASRASFQMVSACHGQQQEQEQQHGPEPHQELQQQQDVHEHKKHHQLQQQHQGLDGEHDGEHDGEPDEEPDRERPSLGAWQEDEEVVIAMQMSLRDIAEQAEPIADSSSIISSNSSNSSSSSSAASAPPTLMLPKITNQRKVPKQASNVPVPKKVPMEKIEEVHASEYIDSSGCTATIFTDKPTTNSSQVIKCPMHQLEHNSYCRACTNYQFMKEKQQYSMAMQHSIQASYHAAADVVFIDQLPCCSSHDQDLKEWCHTCRQVVDLRDQMAQME